MLRVPTPVRVFLGPLCILSLAACATSEIAEPVSPVDDAVLRTARSTTPGYTALNLAPLPGHSTASAEAVNDAGVVLGQSSSSAGTQIVLWANGQITALTGISEFGMPLDMSNGATTYITGHKAIDGTSRGMRWTVSGSPASITETLMVPGGFGFPEGVNDLGDIIGRKIRFSDGTIVDPVLPEGFTLAQGVDINNARHSAFTLHGPSRPARGFVRLASGDMVRLDPPASMAADTSVAGAMSETVVDGSGRSVVYVAGKIQRTDIECSPARWTVDVGTGNVIAVEVRAVGGSAWAANSLGEVAGTYGQRWSVSPFIWKATQFSALPLPKAMNNGKVRGMSSNGRYMAGHAEQRLTNRAILWTAP